MAEAKTTKKKAATKPEIEATETPAEPKPARPSSEGGKAPRKATPKADKSQFAVFATGGKQYRVSVGDKVKIEKLSDDHKEGDSITFNDVLLIDNGASEANIGTPFIKGSSVTATLTKIGRYKTVDVVKYKQKSRYYKKYGHRQPFFEVTIESIK